MKAPRKILALSFSNKACANLRVRLRRYLGANYWRRVTVSNFHGLCARLVRSHGYAIDLDPEIRLPEKAWRDSAMQRLAPDWRVRARVEEVLRELKAQGISNEEIRARLASTGPPEALRFQEELEAENRLDYDDLLRAGEQILAIDGVRRLYRSHFAAVFVDEIQDLTRRQLELTLALGKGRLTAVGDRAQGIYGFAGADPIYAFETVEALNPAVAVLDSSFRSAPRVVDAINALGVLLGSPPLTCARSDQAEWPGTVAVLERPDTTEEARAVLDHVAELLARNPQLRVGIVVRSQRRAYHLEQEIERRHIPTESWYLPGQSAAVLALVRTHLPSAVARASHPGEIPEALAELCEQDVAPEDADLRDELRSALAWIQERLELGEDPDEVVARIRQIREPTAAVSPGLHLLNAHVGKGQEFDWVVVLGLEEGNIPDFRAEDESGLEEELRALNVMVSRARDGLLITRTEYGIPDRWGRQHRHEASRWWAAVADVANEAW